jgi:hypothetical protein
VWLSVITLEQTAKHALWDGMKFCSGIAAVFIITILLRLLGLYFNANYCIRFLVLTKSLENRQYWPYKRHCAGIEIMQALNHWKLACTETTTISNMSYIAVFTWLQYHALKPLQYPPWQLYRSHHIAAISCTETTTISTMSYIAIIIWQLYRRQRCSTPEIPRSAGPYSYWQWAEVA